MSTLLRLDRDDLAVGLVENEGLKVAIRHGEALVWVDMDDLRWLSVAAGPAILHRAEVELRGT